MASNLSKDSDEKQQKPSICLVKLSESSRKLIISTEATDLLRGIKQPVAVLGICGPYRSGKSYFLSRLMGSNDFKVSHSVEPCTRGIWISTSVKNLKHCEGVIVALDTEGIGAAQASEASSKEEVVKYLVLTTLLSSCLIYNAKGAIEESHLQQMSCFGELSKSVVVSENSEGQLKEHFPDFLWLMRDCDLNFDESQSGIIATDYFLQKILVEADVNETAPSDRDRTADSIRRAFPKIECIRISTPGPGISNPKKRKFIDPDFYTEMDEAIAHIVANIRTKHTRFNESTPINGPMLASLLEYYVDALNKPDTLPNLEVSYWSAVKTTLKNMIFEKAEEYRKQMSALVDPHLPLEEGGSVKLESALDSTIKEASQRVLEEVALPLSVSKTDTLLQIHELVFNHHLSILTAELHKLIPDSSEKSVSERIKLLGQYKQLLITVSDGKVTGGFVQHSIEANREKSKKACEELFESLYRQQLESENVSLQQLETDYYRQAVGPEKAEVCKHLLPEIPRSPTDLAHHSETNGHVRVTWKRPDMDPAVTLRYKVQWRSEGEGVKQDTLFNTLEIKLPNHLPKTTYNVKVQAVNFHKSRFGEFSKELTFTTNAWRPDTPDMITVTPETDVTAKLGITLLPEKRENGSPVTHIHVSRCSDIRLDWQSLQSHPLGQTRGDHLLLPVDTKCVDDEKTLWFRVQFENEAGLSNPSKSVQLNVDDMIPGKPENIVTKCEAREITLTWDPPRTNSSAVRIYRVQYWEKQTLKARIDTETNDDVRSLVLCPLSPNTEYTIRLYAKNANSKHVEYQTITARTMAAIPDRPQLLTVKALTATKARLSLIRQQPSEENGSKVEKVVIEQRMKSQKGVTNWMEIGEHSVQFEQEDDENVDLEFELSNLTSRSTMCFRIRTVNSVGKSEPSREVELHSENIYPGEPKQLEASELQSSIIKLTWNPPDHNSVVVSRYYIQYKSEADETLLSKTVDSNVFTCTVSELRPNAEYNFTVQSINGHLASQVSCLQARTTPSKPPKPRPPIAVPQREVFSLQLTLPAVEESGREVTDLYVHFYNFGEDSEEHFEIDISKVTLEEGGRSYKQQIKINIDETKWISVRFSNEVGRSEESDLVALSTGEVTPGPPVDLTSVAESRKVHLSWKVPAVNGNAAKYYEVQIKEDDKWTTQGKNCTVHQQRDGESLTYYAEVRDLRPFTLYQFGVQAVNNTTKKILVGERATLKVTTNKSPPEQPSSPAVELVDEQRAEVEITLLSEDQMNGSCVDKAILRCNDEKLMVFDIPKEEQTSKTLSKMVTLPNLTNPTITAYCFQVEMVNEVGKSKPSDPFPLPVTQLKPSPPLDLKVIEVTAHSMKVSWLKPRINHALITHYCLQYYQRRQKQYKEEKHTTDTEYLMNGLQTGQEYTIKVTAVVTKTNVSKVQRVKQSTPEIFPGPPTVLYVDKRGSDKVKIRWRKPKENPLEVVFYFIELRKGDLSKEVVRSKRVLGTSTVLRDLEPYTTFTVSVSSCNDNKRCGKKSSVHETFSTKMSSSAKTILKVLTLPSVAGPFVLQYSQSPDSNMDASDEEYPRSSGVYPGPPEELTVTHAVGYMFDVKWKHPRKNFDELWYYKVSVSRRSSTRSLKFFYPKRRFQYPFDPDIEYTISVTSINFAGEEEPDHHSTNQLTRIINNQEYTSFADIQSLM